MTLDQMIENALVHDVLPHLSITFRLRRQKSYQVCVYLHHASWSHQLTVLDISRYYIARLFNTPVLLLGSAHKDYKTELIRGLLTHLNLL